MKTIATAIVGREVSGLTGLYCHFIYLAHNFILSKDEAADLGIKQDFLKPSLPSSRQLQDSIILSDHDGYPIIEKQLVVIDSNLSERALKSACPALWSYLQQREASGIRDLYLSRRAWARLIRKVWAADPLACPKCGGGLRIIAFIDNPAVLEKILRHFKLWAPPERPPPPRRSTTLEPDADFLAWETTGRLFDGID